MLKQKPVLCRETVSCSLLKYQSASAKVPKPKNLLRESESNLLPKLSGEENRSKLGNTAAVWSLKARAISNTKTLLAWMCRDRGVSELSFSSQIVMGFGLKKHPVLRGRILLRNMKRYSRAGGIASPSDQERVKHVFCRLW